MLKSKCKRFLLSPSNACWTVQCSDSLLLLVFGFSASGKVLWRLAWLAAEKCHSKARSKSAYCSCTWAAPYFIKKNRALSFQGKQTEWNLWCIWSCCASGAVSTPSSQRCTFWIVGFILCNYRHINQKHLHDTKTSEVRGRCLQKRWIALCSINSTGRRLWPANIYPCTIQVSRFYLVILTVHVISG